MQHKIKETYEFVHKGISVYVRIDYFNNKIGILEMVNIMDSKLRKKEFFFIGRGVEYMQGWRNILEAVSEATKDAQKKYEANLAEESKFKNEALVDALDFIERLDDKSLKTNRKQRKEK